MSGSKAFAVAGISQVTASSAAGTAAVGTASGVSGAAIATGAATLLGLAALVAAAGIVVVLTGKALQAHQERLRKEQEAAEQREREVQHRIAKIRSQIRSSPGQLKVAVKLPATVTSTTQTAVTTAPSASAVSTQVAAAKDAQRRVNDLKSRLPKIRSEYQTLVDQQLLDSQTVQEALQRTEEALNTNNLTGAEAHLQALDEARILAIQQLRSQWLPQIQYLQERLNGVRSRIPQEIVQELQTNIEQLSTNWQHISDVDIETLHQQISTFEAQADSIQKAAENLIKSQHEVGYVAYLREIDNGDAVIEVKTHKGANTEIRIQFYGQQISLEGPPEEAKSCATRTVEAMRIFQEQGYQLEWTEWDGRPVQEELRHLYFASSQGASATEESYEPQSSQRRTEAQGY